MAAKRLAFAPAGVPMPTGVLVLGGAGGAGNFIIGDYPSTASGITFGRISGNVAGVYDEGAGVASARGRGRWHILNTVGEGTLFRLDLDASGDYDISLMIGGYGSYKASFRLFDGASATPLFTYDVDINPDNNEVIDATGALMAMSNWDNQQALKRVTITSTYLMLEIGNRGGVGFSDIRAFDAIPVGAPTIPTARALQFIDSTVPASDIVVGQTYSGIQVEAIDTLMGNQRATTFTGPVTLDLDVTLPGYTVRGGPVTVNAVAGVATFNNIIFDEDLVQAVAVSIAAPSSTNVTVGTTLTLVATVTNDNTTAPNGVTWETSSASIATVSSTGVVTPVAPGAVTITARSAKDTTKTATQALTMVAAPVVSVAIATPSTTNLTVGGSTLTLAATVTNDNSTAPNGVTWETSAAGVATVSSAGVVTPVSAGSVTITARSKKDTTKTATQTLTVTAAGVVSVSITPPGSLTLVIGTSITLTASVANDSQTAPNGVTWETSASNVAAVNASGVVTPGVAGSVTITARAKKDTTKTASLTFTVVAPGTGTDGFTVTDRATLAAMTAQLTNLIASVTTLTDRLTAQRAVALDSLSYLDVAVSSRSTLTQAQVGPAVASSILKTPANLIVTNTNGAITTSNPGGLTTSQASDLALAAQAKASADAVGNSVGVLSGSITAATTAANAAKSSADAASLAAGAAKTSADQAASDAAQAKANAAQAATNTSGNPAAFTTLLGRLSQTNADKIAALTIDGQGRVTTLNPGGLTTSESAALTSISSATATTKASTDSLLTKLSDSRMALIDKIGTLTISERNTLVNTLLDSTDAIETQVTVRGALRLMTAILGGVLEGANTSAITFKNPTGNTTRVIATTDDTGRTSITLNLN